MANEASVRTSLQIQKGNLDYQGRPTSFSVTMTGSGGPTPGTISVATTITNIDLSRLTTPGLCRIMNLDATNYVEFGVHDGYLFHPVLEIGPGESYVVNLSRNITEEDQATGTGTTGNVNNLALRANTAACLVLVEAFEK